MAKVIPSINYFVYLKYNFSEPEAVAFKSLADKEKNNFKCNGWDIVHDPALYRGKNTEGILI